MKKYYILSVLAIAFSLVFNSCSKDDDPANPTIRNAPGINDVKGVCFFLITMQGDVSS